MTSKEFCYWLQGKIEIPENDNTTLQRKGTKMTREQQNVIKTHMKLVYAMNEINPEAKDSKTMGFVNGLKEYFTSLSHLEYPRWDLVANELNQVFYHTIDQSYGDQSVQDILNSIHNEEYDDNVARC